MSFVYDYLESNTFHRDQDEASSDYAKLAGLDDAPLQLSDIEYLAYVTMKASGLFYELARQADASLLLSAFEAYNADAQRYTAEQNVSTNLDHSQLLLVLLTNSYDYSNYPNDSGSYRRVERATFQFLLANIPDLSSFSSVIIGHNPHQHIFSSAYLHPDYCAAFTATDGMINHDLSVHLLMSNFGRIDHEQLDAIRLAINPSIFEYPLVIALSPSPETLLDQFSKVEPSIELLGLIASRCAFFPNEFSTEHMAELAQQSLPSILTPEQAALLDSIENASKQNMASFVADCRKVLPKIKSCGPSSFDQAPDGRIELLRVQAWVLNYLATQMAVSGMDRLLKEVATAPATMDSEYPCYGELRDFCNFMTDYKAGHSKAAYSTNSPGLEKAIQLACSSGMLDSQTQQIERLNKLLAQSIPFTLACDLLPHSWLSAALRGEILKQMFEYRPENWKSAKYHSYVPWDLMHRSSHLMGTALAKTYAIDPGSLMLQPRPQQKNSALQLAFADYGTHGLVESFHEVRNSMIEAAYAGALQNSCAEQPDMLDLPDSPRL